MHQGTLKNMVTEDNCGASFAHTFWGQTVSVGLPGRDRGYFLHHGNLGSNGGRKRLERLPSHVHHAFPALSFLLHTLATAGSSPLTTEALGLGPALPASGDPHTSSFPPHPAQIYPFCKTGLDQTANRMSFSLLLCSCFYPIQSRAWGSVGSFIRLLLQQSFTEYLLCFCALGI